MNVPDILARFDLHSRKWLDLIFEPHTCIEQTRILVGVSQERFAQIMGTTTRTICRWEAATSLSLEILNHLRRAALDVSATEAAEYFESRIRAKLGWSGSAPKDLCDPTIVDGLVC